MNEPFNYRDLRASQLAEIHLSESALLPRQINELMDDRELRQLVEEKVEAAIQQRASAEKHKRERPAECYQAA